MVSTSAASSFSLQPVSKSSSYLICKEQVPWFSFSSRPAGIGHMEYPKTAASTTSLFRNQQRPDYNPRHWGCPRGSSLCWQSCEVAPASLHWSTAVLAWHRLFPFPCASSVLLAGAAWESDAKFRAVPLTWNRTNSLEGAFLGTTRWKISILLARDNFWALSSLVMNWIPASLSF